jgi:hypothetical protein
MRILAAIIMIIFTGLLLQPSLLPVKQQKGKVMSCCAKKANKKAGCEKGKGCCNGNDQCNPFYSQCPLCAAVAIPVAGIALPEQPIEFYTPVKYSVRHQSLHSNYIADLLRPPISMS